MSQPPRYTPNHSFVSDSATLANFPGQQLDVEFQEIKSVTDAIETNLALIQRDDGGLANGIVTYDALSSTLQANGLAPASAWVTGTAYLIGNAVVINNTLYRCLVAHTSSVFATDLTAARWILVTTLLYSAGTNISFAGSVISVVSSPTFVAPTATTLNGNTFTTGTYTLTGAAGKTFTFSNTLTVAGTDGTTLTFQGTDTYVGRATTDTLTNKTLTAPVVTGATITTSTYNGNTWTAGTGVLTIAALKTLTANASLTLAGTDGTTLIFQGTDTYVGRATTDTLTNKTFDTAGAGNVLKINGTTISANTGTGSNVLASSPTITNPAIVGTATNDSAAAGNVGEYVSGTVAAGSPVALAGAGTVVNVTSISLTAGDWDVSILGYFAPAATTNVTFATVGISTTSATLDSTEGKFAQLAPNGVPALPFTVVIPAARLSLSGTTTVYFIARSGFSVSTNSAYGVIRARRVR